MLLAREFIGYLSRQLVSRLSPSAFETSDPAVAAAAMAHIIEEDLSVEDKLNDEVRDLLDQYSDYMRRENVSYQEMFRKIKNQLLAQRKILRAAGRDTPRRTRRVTDHGRAGRTALSNPGRSADRCALDMPPAPSRITVLIVPIVRDADNAS